MLRAMIGAGNLQLAAVVALDTLQLVDNNLKTNSKQITVLPTACTAIASALRC